MSALSCSVIQTWAFVGLSQSILTTVIHLCVPAYNCHFYCPWKYDCKVLFVSFNPWWDCISDVVSGCSTHPFQCQHILEHQLPVTHLVKRCSKLLDERKLVGTWLIQSHEFDRGFGNVVCGVGVLLWATVTGWYPIIYEVPVGELLE